MSAAPTLMRKTLRGLEPANDLSRQAFAKIKLDDVVRVDIRRPRSLAWHRRYWALVSLIADNTSYTADQVHALLKLRCGLAEPIKERNGTVAWVPSSIAFDRLDAAGWSAYWDRVVTYASTELLPGVSAETLRREVAELIGMPGLAE